MLIQMYRIICCCSALHAGYFPIDEVTDFFHHSPTKAAQQIQAQSRYKYSSHFSSTLQLMDRLRDHRGRFMKSPSFNLFGLPPELRLMIYTHYLSREEVPLKASIWFSMPSTYRSHLVKKLPLLRTSSVVLAEALTIFYQSYCFWIRVPRLSYVPFPPLTLEKIPNSEDISQLTLVLSRITKVRLIDTFPARRSNWDENFPPCVQCLLDQCPQLRLLRLDILEHPSNFRNIFGKLYRLPKTASLLAELWKRLDRLEVSVVHCGHTSEDTGHGDASEGFRELIAPKSCWIRQCSVELRGYSCSRTTWLLKRTTKVSDELEQ